MKVARSTKERIAHIKAEANEPKSRLINLLARLEEHSGNKRICRKLSRVICELEEWQQDRGYL